MRCTDVHATHHCVRAEGHDGPHMSLAGKQWDAVFRQASNDPWLRGAV